jgi:predicted signal transduction protein with EAL and GGDEF domain
MEIEKHRISIGASIGIAVAPFDGTKPEELLRKADLALYRAKSSRSGFCAFDPEVDADIGKQATSGSSVRASAA